MKTIGLLGGTGWTSTIDYYRHINQLVNKSLGGYHSAKILLKSIDYHDIMSTYGKDRDKVATFLKQELEGLIALKPDCILICCNSLHKSYDMIKDSLKTDIPVFHVVELTAERLVSMGIKQALLLATPFTMKDGFFAKILEKRGIKTTIPNKEECQHIEIILDQLLDHKLLPESRNFMECLITKYKEGNEAVILGCTEFPLLVTQENSSLPLINPGHIQMEESVKFALKD